MSSKIDSKDLVIPVKYDRDEWIELLEVLEFAHLTYAGVADKSMKEGNILQATHALKMSKSAQILLDKAQNAAINSVYDAGTVH
jgi:hypothetical protein